MTNQQKLYELVNKRYNGDTFSYETEITKNTEVDVIKNKDIKVSTKEENTKLRKAEKEYKEALAYIKDSISPAYMKVSTDKIQINNTYAKTFFVYSYPSYLE
ncbi:MAG: hypothetical protein U9Q66_00885 [Patescibacteria group bacterium]|nr:hypothetical protein [Patescibacteria group bacterium]